MDAQITPPNAAEPAPGKPKSRRWIWIGGIGAMALLLVVAGIVYFAVLPTMYFNAAHTYYDKGEYDRAFAEWDKAIRLKPDYADAYYRRGLAYINRSDFDKAVADFDKAIEINPKQPAAFANRGLAYYRNDDQARAIADFDQALQLNPDYLFAYARRGIVYDAQGDRDRANADFDRVIATDPKSAEDYYSRGLAYSMKNEHAHFLMDKCYRKGYSLTHQECYRKRFVSSWENVTQTDSLTHGKMLPTGSSFATKVLH